MVKQMCDNISTARRWWNTEGPLTYNPCNSDSRRSGYMNLTISPAMAEHLMPKLERDVHVDGNGCHVRTAGMHQNGYTRVKSSYTGKPKTYWAHRISYTYHKGEIPDGLTIDHLCKNTACMNPDHLEAVTQAENVRRSDNAAALNARRTHCRKGHPLTVRTNGKRNCLLCFRETRRRGYAKKVRSRKPLAVEDARHGTSNAYTNLGCRCERCKSEMRRIYAQKCKRPVMSGSDGEG